MSRLVAESPRSVAVRSIVSIAALLAIGVALSRHGGFAWKAASGEVARARAEDRRTAGYYEDLLDAGRDLGAASWTAGASDPVPADWLKLHDTDGVVWDDPFQRFRLRPNANLDYKGVPLGVSDLGLRDRPSTQARRPDVRRVALVGSSILMGSGVPVGSTFENLVEDAIALGALGDRGEVELLNFAVAGYRFDQLVDVVLARVEPFDPDAVVVVLNDLALNPNWMRHLVWLLDEDRDLRYDGLRTLVEDAGIGPGDTVAAMTVKLEPHRNAMLAWGLGEIRRWSTERGIPVMLLVVSQPGVADRFGERVAEIEDLLAAGGLPRLSLLAAYEGVVDPATLWLRPWDRHPTADGHRLLADEWIDQWRRQARLADLILGPDRGSSAAEPSDHAEQSSPETMTDDR